MRGWRIKALTKIILIAALFWSVIFMFKFLGRAIGSHGTISAPTGALIFFLFLLSASLAVIFFTPPLTNFIAQVFMRLISDRSKKVFKTYSIAKSHLAKEEYEKAIEEYHKCLNEDPCDVHAQSQIADIFCGHLKDYQQAIIEYKKVLEMMPNDKLWVFTVNRIADIYSQHLNDPERARDILRNIIKRFPQTRYSKAAENRIARL